MKKVIWIGLIVLTVLLLYIFRDFLFGYMQQIMDYSAVSDGFIGGSGQ